MYLSYIKRYLSSKLGSDITIVYYGMRNRKEKYIGKINNVYDNVFTIILTDGTIKCFNYIDILIKTIQIYI